MLSCSAALAAVSDCAPPKTPGDAALAKSVAKRLTELKAGRAAGEVRLTAVKDASCSGGGTAYRVSKGGESVGLNSVQFKLLTEKDLADRELLGRLSKVLGVGADEGASHGAARDAESRTKEDTALGTAKARMNLLLSDPFGTKKDDGAQASVPAAQRVKVALRPAADAAAALRAKAVAMIPPPPAGTAQAMSSNLTKVAIGAFVMAGGVVLVTAGAGTSAAVLGGVVLIGGVAYTGYQLWQFLAPMRGLGDLLGSLPSVNLR